MKANLFSMLIAAAIPAAALAAEPQTGSGETNGYRLVWQDLFDAEELNPLRWNIEVTNSGGGNNELQYYTDRPENVRLGDDGQGNRCLILTARRENYINRNFTSGRVNSKNFVTFTHGKIEASIKLPVTANGLWPAFWMMGNDYDQVGWPKCGETDILEMGHSTGIKNGTSDRYFNGACHWGEGWPNASHAQDNTKSYSLQDGQFHLFTLIWDENSYRMYVDLDKQPLQTPYFRINIPASTEDWNPGKYFHKDNFLLFNLAVGGNFPGIHDAAGITALNDENGQQASMYVNYVKVYQLPDDATSTLFSAVESDPIDTSGMAPVLAADDVDITFGGSEIAVSKESDIEVFNIGGSCVAKACAVNRLSVGHLASGVYIVRAGRSSLKIVK